MKKRICMIVTALSLVFLTPAYGQEAEIGPGVGKGEALAPAVTEAMCTPQYWLSNSPSEKSTLLSPEEICNINALCFQTQETNMNKLSELPQTFLGRELLERLLSWDSPKNLYLNGQPVPEAYYEAIRENIRRTPVAEEMPLQYAVAVNRSLMKSLPYKDLLSDDPADFEWDQLSSSPVMVNEPLVLYLQTADGAFSYVRSEICSGWVPSEDIAICRDKAEWESCYQSNDILVVTGEKIWLEASLDCPEASNKCLAMGTVLELCKNQTEPVNSRMPWNNYTVFLPCRNADGSLIRKKVLIPANRDVHIGYLPMTTEKILDQAFKLLGNRYGWGGMLNSQDCSSFVREIYLCFGMKLPRNTTWQAAMPVKKLSMEGKSDQEKAELLNQLPAGTILQFRGHEMLYLGAANGRYYTINDVSSLVASDDSENQKLKVRSVIINSLDTKRANGSTWLSNINLAIVPWELSE